MTVVGQRAAVQKYGELSALTREILWIFWSVQKERTTTPAETSNMAAAAATLPLSEEPALLLRCLLQAVAAAAAGMKMKVFAPAVRRQTTEVHPMVITLLQQAEPTVMMVPAMPQEEKALTKAGA